MRKYTRNQKSKVLTAFMNDEGVQVQPCAYLVIDLDTGLLLARGTKYKCFDMMPVSSTYRWFFRRRTVYKRETTIKGRLCVIFYAVGDVREIWGSCICSAGRLLNLKARFYENVGQDVSQCTKLLLANGYVVKEVKCGR